MAKKPLPSPELLRQLLRYEPETGKLFWQSDKYKHVSGQEVRTSNSNGYLVFSILGFVLRVHRVAWAIHNGKWPDAIIDHINQDKKDNRIANLRLSDASANARNARLSIRNKSGTTGVYWYGKLGKWWATISHNGRNRHLGYFENIDDAIAVRKKSEQAFGYSPLHGRRKTN